MVTLDIDPRNIPGKYSPGPTPPRASLLDCHRPSRHAPHALTCNLILMETALVHSPGIPRLRQSLATTKRQMAQRLFDRYFRWRLTELMAPEQALVLEYRVSPTPRYGYGKPPRQRLHEILSRNRDEYARRLTEFLSLSEVVQQILQERNSPASAIQPTFRNHLFNKLDAVALMGFLRELRPNILLEVGSGNSTKFARRAIKHFGLPTKIISCDPEPRTDIKEVSDQIVSIPAEDLPLSFFTQLEEGDILFIDSSHRALQNSDVTLLLLDVLPYLKKGVVVQVHDIFLPYDYPPEWSSRFYSEQYFLAALMTANPDQFEILLPNAFLSYEPELVSIIKPLLAVPGEVGLDVGENDHGFLGGSIWLRLREKLQPDPVK